MRAEHDTFQHMSSLTASQWYQIVNSATDTAIISTDEKGIVTTWNTGAERIFGWAEADRAWRESSLKKITPGRCYSAK